MNKTVIIGAIAIVLAGLGYYQFSVVPAQKAAEQAAADAKAAEEEAAAAAKKAEEEAAAAAKKAEEEAAAAAKAAEEAAAKAAADAAAAASTAAQDATAAATDATAAASDAAAKAMELLDPAKFDADKLTALIDGSSLDDATKGTLKSAVAAAKTNPSLVDATIAQVKTALGL